MASKETENYINRLYHDKNSTYITTEFEDVLLKEAFDAGVESEKKKHEWHNLEENPNDLPKHNNQILVAFAFNKVTNEFYCFDIANYFDGAKSFITNTSDGSNINNGKKVIAWKEIE